MSKRPANIGDRRHAVEIADKYCDRNGNERRNRAPKAEEALELARALRNIKKHMPKAKDKAWLANEIALIERVFIRDYGVVL